MGGMETYCLRLTEEMAKTQKLEIIALPGKSNGDVPSALSLIWFGITTALQLLFMKPVATVHIGDVASWPLGWIASLRHPRSKIILSAHGSDLNFATGTGPWSSIYAKYIWLASKLLGNAKIIANSEWIAELARGQGFAHVVTVPLATDMKANHVSSGHNGCLFFAGRIMPSKGLSFIVERVLPLLSQPLKIRVAGTVWDKQEGLILSAPAVEYLGVLEQDHLAQEFEQALCVVVPSLSREGFGLVAAEAAACGGVVLASDHSGLAEVVTKEVGFVVDSTIPADWAAAIEKIQNWSQKNRADHVRQSMSVARTQYSWDRTAQDTLAAY